MTPDQLLRSLERADPKPVYLFLGPEVFKRRLCREAVIGKLLQPEERDGGADTP